jgi:hypothetical protein
MADPAPPLSPVTKDEKTRSPRRWPRRLLVLALVLGTCYLARCPILRGAAWLLISEDAPEATDYVIPLEGEGQLTEAVRLYRDGQITGVLLLSGPLEPAQVLGILPSEEEEARRTLARQGVPNCQLVVVSVEHGSDWDRIRRLGAWLAERPTTKVTILCSRLHSARCRHLLRTVLAGEVLSRIRLRALSHPDYDEGNWWHTKQGSLDFFNSLLSYAHLRLCGEHREERPAWNPDQYEKSLK